MATIPTMTKAADQGIVRALLLALLLTVGVATAWALSVKDNRKQPPVIVGLTQQAATIVGASDLSLDKVEIARNALAVFWKECVPRFGKHWADATAVRASYEMVNVERDIDGDVVSAHPYFRKYRWTNFVEIVVTMSPSPKTFDNPIGVAGHNFYYRLGAGRRPGIISTKTRSRELCGIPAGSNEPRRVGGLR